MKDKLATCTRMDGTAEEAAHFYTSRLPDRPAFTRHPAAEATIHSSPCHRRQGWPEAA